MTDTATVEQIWRYPVKSMMGSRMTVCDVTSTGITADRAYAIRDETRGAIQGAKRHGTLMSCTAEFVTDPGPSEPGPSGPGPSDAGPAPAPPALITLPDGTSVRTDDETVHDVLSGLLGVPVTLWPIVSGKRGHYRRPRQAPWHAISELKQVLDVHRGEPLPRLHRLSPRLIANETLPGTYFDAAPIMLISTASFAALREALPDSIIDERRFRPGLVLDVDDAAADVTHRSGPEQGWIGRTLTVGTAQLKVISTCPRCVMTTRGFLDVPEDRQILRTIAKEFGRNVGVYANVTRPGRIAVGDSVQVG